MGWLVLEKPRLVTEVINSLMNVFSQTLVRACITSAKN